MSKTHETDNTDIDQALDAFIKSRKTQPVVSSVGSGIDVFGSPEVKKKSLLQRIVAALQTLLR